MEGKRVDSKLMLFTLVLVLIVLLLLNFWFNNNRTDDIWNYEEITTASNIIYLGEKSSDRQVYYILENIVGQYINSYGNFYSNNSEGNKLMYDEYYDYLTEAYRKYLNKSEYIEIAKKFLNKFYVNIDSEYEKREYMDTDRVIKAVYKFENNVYLCELESSNVEKVGYIAIKLDTTENAFNIVYIE